VQNPQWQDGRGELPKHVIDPAGITRVSNIISIQLLTRLYTEYDLNWDGIHGYFHWVRVRENGLRIAQINGARPALVELFAFLHDIKRQNDGIDYQHGKRAAGFIGSINQDYLHLRDTDCELLQYACAFHTNGLTEGDVTVKTCWDADRLDLGRVGIKPNARRLCTQAARQPEIIEWAYGRSRAGRQSV
jgi:uncharacterized protein